MLRREQHGLRGALEDVLRYLVDLSRTTVVAGQSVPGWYVPVERQFLEVDKQIYPHGNFNCGLAHGICGPLALLSLALMAGVVVEGQSAAMKRMAQWLLLRQRQDELGMYWPSHVDWHEEIGARTPSGSNHRAAWCYGTPGVARTLWLAGHALGDEHVTQIATRALRDCLARPEADWLIDGPILCHGRAGLLQIVRRMHLDSAFGELAAQMRRLAEMLINQFDATTIFGYQDLDPVDGVLRRTDKPGLLDGASGVGLVMLGLAAPDVKPMWDCAFLLA